MKKLFSISCLALAVGLAGCGNNATSTQNSTQSTSDTTASTAPSTANQYVSPLPDTAPVVKVATTGTQPPFSYQDEYGTMVGIDIDAIRAIGEDAGFKVEFYQEPWQNVFPSVVAGHRDLAISGISYSDQRATDFLLSDSYLFVPSAIMYKDANLNIKQLSDLKGLRFGGMKDAKQINDVIASGTPNVDITATKTVYLAYEKLIRGEVDAIAEDIQWLQYTAQQYPEYKVHIVPYEDENSPPANQVIMMKKDNTELANKINASIAKLKASGKFQEIEQKYLTNKS